MSFLRLPSGLTVAVHIPQGVTNAYIKKVSRRSTPYSADAYDDFMLCRLDVSLIFLQKFSFTLTNAEQHAANLCKDDWILNMKSDFLCSCLVHKFVCSSMDVAHLSLVGLCFLARIYFGFFHYKQQLFIAYPFYRQTAEFSKCTDKNYLWLAVFPLYWTGPKLIP